jgi:hypothetical protein
MITLKDLLSSTLSCPVMQPDGCACGYEMLAEPDVRHSDGLITPSNKVRCASKRCGQVFELRLETRPGIRASFVVVIVMEPV